MRTKYLKNSSDIKVKADKLFSIYKKCELCPWECRVDRIIGKLGVCKSSNKVKISSYVPHFGEEPMISGTKGSGTIFFSNCNLKCRFCQNWQISQHGMGKEISDDELANIMIELQNKDCHNINLVSPTQYVPNIVNAISIAIEKGLTIPIVYNSNGYERPEVIELLEGVIDIYLPDMKYSSDDNSVKYSVAPKYAFYNRRSVLEMFRQVGTIETDENGIAIKGLLIRHLVLPNDISGSERTIKFISRELSKNVDVSIMSQYSPQHEAMKYSELSRKISKGEYERVIGWAEENGLNNILGQQLPSSDTFVPDFERADPFK